MKPRTIRLSLVPAVAAAAMASGCGSPRSSNPQALSQSACVDWNQTVVERQKCEEEQQRLNQNPTGYRPQYGWYFYRSPSPVGIGMHVPGGGAFSSSGMGFRSGATGSSGSTGSSGTVGSVSRGGFGSTAHGTSAGA